MSKPQITEIARVLAGKLSADGAEQSEAVEAWRQTLRYARRSGVIEDIATAVVSEDPEDAGLKAAARDMTVG